MIKKTIQIIVTYSLLIFIFTGGAIQCNNPIETPTKIMSATRKFNYPLTFGTKWTYRYSYYSRVDGKVNDVRGSQYWIIVDSISNDNSTTFIFKIISQDTSVKYSVYLPPDTSYTIDTSSFYIERYSSFIIVHCPAYSYYSKGDTLTEIIGASNTIIIGDEYPDDNGKATVYKDNIGLFSFTHGHSTNSRSLLKLEFVKIEK